MNRTTAPTVGVVIPVFNRPVAVRRAIDSVLAQTFQDFEIVVVDDGSTDETPGVLAEVGDPRLRVVHHEQRRGGSAARNSGIRATSAPFVAFLDSDDEWLPTKLERQLEVFQRADDGLALVYTAVERRSIDGHVSQFMPSPPANLRRELLLRNVIGETSLGMVRRTALEAIGGFDEQLPSCQDLDLWLRLCERYRAELVPEVLVRATTGAKDRISADIAKTETGRQMYCDKHRQKLLRYGILHTFLRESGWRYQREARDSRQARRCYRESLAVNPLSLPTYALLIASWMPLGWLDRAAAVKRQVSALLPSSSHA